MKKSLWQKYNKQRKFTSVDKSMSTDVLIIHKEAGSTKEILKDKKKKKIKFQIQSYFKVVKLLFYDYKKIKKLYN